MPAAHSQSDVSTLSTELRLFIKDSEDHRARIERDQSAIWTAIKQQGQQLQEAIDKLSSRGAITWPLIVMTITVMLGIVGTASTIGHAFVENRVRQLEIIDTQSERERDQLSKRLEKMEDARIRELEARAAGRRD